mgnify:CR=1 FL=1
MAVKTSKSLSRNLIVPILTPVILFHFMAILLLPNYGSFLGRRYLQPMAEWGNFLMLNSSWNFFSPDPAHIMYFRYELNFENGTSRAGLFPAEGEQPTANMSRRRDLYLMRFLVLDMSRIEHYLAPWLCRLEPNVRDVSLTHTVKLITPLEKYLVNAGSATVGEMQTYESNYLCHPEGQ